MNTGFSNWKDAISSFKKHAKSDAHLEAVDEVFKLPRITKDVGELLSAHHAEQKLKARKMLLLVMSGIRYLARQGLPLRGHGSGESSNLIQLLRYRGEDTTDVQAWLEKSAQKHIHSENQNEMLQLMAHSVLRSLLDDIRGSPFWAVMVDETTDISNVEQMTVFVRWVAEDFTVSEEFLGMHSMAAIDAESIVKAMLDVFVQLELPIHKLRGQCYDGCSTMTGKKSGVATRVSKLEPRALYTHCFGHALNLAVSDTVKRSPIMKDCLDCCYEIVKLVKFSPNREAMLKQLKEECGADDTPNLRTLCPTRWTVRATSLASILANYDHLLTLWEAAVTKTSDTEMKARIQGVNAVMQHHKFLFALYLSELIFRHTDKLSQTLQNPDLSNVEGHRIAMLVVETLKGIRTDTSFDAFWEKIELSRISLDLDEPSLPRKRKTPARFQLGDGDYHFPASPKDHYRSQYFEALDLAMATIQDRFNQEGFKMLCKVEQLLMKACAGENFVEMTAEICNFFTGDFDEDDLNTELGTLHHLYISHTTESPSIGTVKSALLSLSSAQRSLVGEVCKLLQILLVMPATNASSERSFSALRRIKTYLRSTTRQDRLNHLLVLNYHIERTDNLDMKAILNQYVNKSDARKSTFAMF